MKLDVFLSIIITLKNPVHHIMATYKAWRWYSKEEKQEESIFFWTHWSWVQLKKEFGVWGF